MAFELVSLERRTRQPQPPSDLPLPWSFSRPVPASGSGPMPPSTLAVAPPVPEGSGPPPLPNVPALPPVFEPPLLVPLSTPVGLPPADASGVGTTPASGTGCVQSPLCEHTRPGLQSPFPTQLVRHLPWSPHWNGSQPFALGTTQVATPLHFGASVDAAFAQYASPHTTSTPGSTQLVPVLPSQKPPQAPEPSQLGRPSRGAPATATQVPSCPTWSHDSHCPSHGLSQQRPSTHCPLAHCAGAPHVAPFGCFAVQTPAAQYCVALQLAGLALHGPSHRTPAVSQA
jgi:hypothetical protein